MRIPCLIIGILFALLILVGLFTCRLGGFPVAPEEPPVAEAER